MNILSLLIGLLLLLPPASGNNGREYLEKAIARFDGIKDYTVDVRVHLDIEAVKGPDMQARVYFKAPDKVKVDSKGLFLMPRNVGIINPREFNPDKFDVQVVDTLTYEGDPAVRLSLTPKGKEAGGKEIILTIDKTENLIREIVASPSPGRTAKARISYGEFDGFLMPTEVAVRLDLGKPDGRDKEFEGRRMGMSQMNGNVEVYYTDYKINTGLSDKIFEKRDEE